MEHILWFIINKTFYGFMDCSLLFSFFNWGGSSNLGFLNWVLKIIKDYDVLVFIRNIYYKHISIYVMEFYL